MMASNNSFTIVDISIGNNNTSVGCKNEKKNLHQRGTFPAILKLGKSIFI